MSFLGNLCRGYGSWAQAVPADAVRREPRAGIDAPPFNARFDDSDVLSVEPQAARKPRAPRKRKTKASAYAELFDSEDSFAGDGLGDFAGDELAECKAVIAAFLQETANLNAALEQWRAAVAERDEYIVTLIDERDRACATRDRYQASGKRALAQLRELESIIAFPGVREALLKALHPDTGKGDPAARQTAFHGFMAACARLGIGR